MLGTNVILFTFKSDIFLNEIKTNGETHDLLSIVVVKFLAVKQYGRLYTSTQNNKL